MIITLKNTQNFILSGNIYTYMLSFVVLIYEENSNPRASMTIQGIT